LLNHPLKFYQQTLRGLKILSVDRRAKMIIVSLSGGWRLLIHLKLTGQLVYRGDPNRFTHAIFTFKGKRRLFFNDVRKFGWIRLYREGELDKHLVAMKLGPEPLEAKFTLAQFKRELEKRPNNKIKQFLMDPANLAGIGNIYSDEICFFARVRPTRRVKELTAHEISLLFKGIKKILTAAVKYEGTSISDYVNVQGEAGAYTKKLKVYQRYGEKCFRCPGLVERIKLGGRTSSFCPRCQL